MFVPSPLFATAAAAVPAAAELGPAALAPAAALIALGIGALVFVKRRARPSRLVEILETASLGPKRALIVARVGGETLILGASEAGISLLGSRGGLGDDLAAPAPAAAPIAAAAPEAPRSPARTGTPALAATPAAPGLLGRLRLRKPRPSDAFEPLLRESLEDQELRAKVAAGYRGIVA